MLLESLSLDVEDVRLSLARGFDFPAEHNGVPCLCAMLDFIEKGDYHPFWYRDLGIDEAERKRRERLFDICKAAIIKVVVEVAGEERNEEVLWDDSEEEKPGGEFVSRMVSWIKKYVPGKISGGVETQETRIESSEPHARRDDLVICASLSLGNLSRRGKSLTLVFTVRVSSSNFEWSPEQHARTLLSPPHSLAPVLASTPLLSPSTDIKLKHGILALLKHLAQAGSQSGAINTLTEAGIVKCIIASGIWDDKAGAMAEVVQVNAIGVVKHLCNASGEYAVIVITSPIIFCSSLVILIFIYSGEYICIGHSSFKPRTCIDWSFSDSGSCPPLGFGTS
jgi:hypothetical protein